MGAGVGGVSVSLNEGIEVENCSEWRRLSDVLSNATTGIDCALMEKLKTEAAKRSLKARRGG